MNRVMIMARSGYGPLNQKFEGVVMRVLVNKTTLGKASDHDVTMPLLQSMYDEFKELSKKNLKQRLVRVK